MARKTHTTPKKSAAKKGYSGKRAGKYAYGAMKKPKRGTGRKK